MFSINDFQVRNTSGVPDYKARIYEKKNNETVLLIPVLNEGTRILQQLAALSAKESKVDIVVADGGSTDLTRENIENSDLRIHAFLTKEGEGALSAQLRMGFHYCLSQKYKSVITMDGNNKDDIVGIKKILAALESGIDFVQGSRFIDGGEAVNTPILRYLAIRLLHAPIISIAARHWYTDTTNGFRGHSTKLLEHPEVQIFRDVFSTYELLAYLPIRSKQVGLKVIEVPVVRRYPKGIETPTKIRGINATLNLLRILILSARGAFNPNEI